MKLLHKQREYWTKHVGERLWKNASVEFAKKHDLVYFHSESASTASLLTAGATDADDKFDSNICIGDHAGYDIVMFERVSSASYDGYPTATSRWHVLQIDLKSKHDWPYMFVGTKQQSKAFYAQLLDADDSLEYLVLDTGARRYALFHSHYATLASAKHEDDIARVFDAEVIDTMAEHHYPFAIEINGNSVTFVTKALKPNQQLMNKLLHFGLWFAKEIDKR